jgi:hypothetical protein
MSQEVILTQKVKKKKMKMIIKKKIGLPNLSVTNLNLGREGK